jgi:hypothetical protein
MTTTAHGTRGLTFKLVSSRADQMPCGIRAMANAVIAARPNDASFFRGSSVQVGREG